MALRQHQMLDEFWTCFRWQPSRFTDRVLPENVLKELYRRTFDEALSDHIRTYPFDELMRQFAQRFRWYTLTKDGAPFSIHNVYKKFSRYVSSHLRDREEIDLVHAYEDGALEIFRAARKEGIFCLYELPIAYWRYKYDLLSEEKALQPEWASTLSSLHVPEWLQARKDEELELADAVVVPSSFVRDSVVRYFPQYASKIRVCAYGAPQVDTTIRISRPKGKIKVLFVGSIGQRKGASYMFEIFEKIAPFAEITIIGNPMNFQFERGKQLCNQYRYLGSVPHETVLKEMRSHDVFLLPTLCEGQALVNLEAMGAGMTVITTPNSGATDFIENGKDGYIIPIREVEQAVSLIQELHQQPETLKRVCINARRKAKEFSWDNYQHRYISMLHTLQAGSLLSGYNSAFR